MLSDRLARLALDPVRREQILARTRAILRRQWPEIAAWVGRHDGVLDVIPPRAGAIALVKYALPIAPVALFDRLREEKSVLITPGPHFEIGKYIRVGYGYEIEKLRKGLSKIDEVIGEILSPTRRRRRAV
jgi:aspartate/methionine/tyrosine aminotransferase